MSKTWNFNKYPVIGNHFNVTEYILATLFDLDQVTENELQTKLVQIFQNFLFHSCCVLRCNTYSYNVIIKENNPLNAYYGIIWLRGYTNIIVRIVYEFLIFFLIPNILRNYCLITVRYRKYEIQ